MYFFAVVTMYKKVRVCGLYYVKKITQVIVDFLTSRIYNIVVAERELGQNPKLQLGVT